MTPPSTKPNAPRSLFPRLFPAAWTLAFLLACNAFCRTASAQATAVTVSGTTYTQNFDSMTNSTSAALPGGWSIFRSGTTAAAVPVTYASGSNTTAVTQLYTTGTPTSGGAYLLAPTASGTDKAIGFLGSSSYPGPSTNSASSQLAILFGFTNTTGATITNLDLSWNYEKYREGTRAQSWEFYTSTDGSTWSSGTVGNQSYAGGANTTTMYNPPQQIAKSLSIPSLSIASGSNYYFRWSFLTTGSWSNSQLLGIDDFTMNLTTSGAPVSTDLYWDGGAGWASTAPGSGGTGNWADGSGSWDASKKANFGGTAGTVTSALVTASNGLTFTTTGYTLTGGTITLAGASSSINAITTGTDGTVTTTINSALAGSAGLQKFGQGTLVLGGANTFTGGLTLTSGTLQISSDANLGDAASSVALNSTLKTTASVSLASTRAVSGGGTLDIAPGTALTSSGSFAMSSVTLANSGTLDLQGPTRSVGVLTFTTAATVNGSGAISMTGLTATGVTSGSAIVNPAITFSSGDKTVDVGSGGTLALAGDIAGTTGRIAKTGLGTLIASGSNSTSGYRLGAAGSSPTNGGTLILAAAAASGTGQLQANYGTLQATAPFTFANGLSVGGRSGAVAVLGGTNAMTFSGSTSFFRGTATSGELRLDVNNATTLAGVIGATSGAGTATGITIGGTGALTIAGNASALTETITLQDSVKLYANNSLGGGLNVAAGTLLGGSGTISGAVSVASGGILAPGNSPGTLTIANALTLSGNSLLNFELSATDQTVGGGINDLVTGITNFTLDGTLNVTGIGDFTTVAAGTKWRLFEYSGSLTDLGLVLGSMPTLASGYSFDLDATTAGQVNLLVVVPEPSAIALALLGGSLALLAARRRHKSP